MFGELDRGAGLLPTVNGLPHTRSSKATVGAGTSCSKHIVWFTSLPHSSWWKVRRYVIIWRSPVCTSCQRKGRPSWVCTPGQRRLTPFGVEAENVSKTTITYGIMDTKQRALTVRVVCDVWRIYVGSDTIQGALCNMRVGCIIITCCTLTLSTLRRKRTSLLLFRLHMNTCVPEEPRNGSGFAPLSSNIS